MNGYFNPYTHQDFFGFFAVFFKRIYHAILGNVENGLASDEIQLVILAGIAAVSALVGTFLVLRKMTMLANSLSHTILLGIVLTYLAITFFFKGDQNSYEVMSIPLLIFSAIFTGILTTFLTTFFSKVLKLQEDASIGLIFTILFAAGVVLVTLFTRNVHVGTELVMGNVDALKQSDIRLVYIVLGVNVLLFLCFYKGYKITTFDQGLARLMGFSPLFFNYLLMIQTSGAVISAFRAVGVLMVLAFLVIPVLTARLLTESLIRLIFLAIGVGMMASFAGVALSRHFLTIYGVGLSTSGIVVCTLLLFYFCAALFSPRQGLLMKQFYRKAAKKPL